MRDAAGKLDHFNAALDIALGISNHLAVLTGEHMRQLVHIGFDQALELEHHPRAALRVDLRPARESGFCGVNGGAGLVFGGKRRTGLHLARVRVEHIQKIAAGPGSLGAIDEVVKVLGHARHARLDERAPPSGETVPACHSVWLGGDLALIAWGPQAGAAGKRPPTR